DLDGQTLTLTVVYANGKTDSATVVAGPTDSGDRMPAPTPVSISWGLVSALWIGQDGQDLTGPGDAHVALSGLPAGHAVVSATLDDGVRQVWAYRTDPSIYADPYAGALAFHILADPTRADLDFPPVRDETGAKMTLRLAFDDGSTVVSQFPGGPAD